MSDARRAKAPKLILDTNIEVRWDLIDWPSQVDVSRLGPLLNWIIKHKPEHAPDFNFEAFVKDGFPGVDQAIWTPGRGSKREEDFVYDPIHWPTLCLTIEPAKKLERDLGYKTAWNEEGNVLTYVQLDDPVHNADAPTTSVNPPPAAEVLTTPAPALGTSMLVPKILPPTTTSKTTQDNRTRSNPELTLIRRLTDTHLRNSWDHAVAAMTSVNRSRADWTMAQRYKTLLDKPGPVPPVNDVKPANATQVEVQDFWKKYRITPVRDAAPPDLAIQPHQERVSNPVENTLSKDKPSDQQVKPTIETRPDPMTPTPTVPAKRNAAQAFETPLPQPPIVWPARTAKTSPALSGPSTPKTSNAQPAL
ncbi:hypothetical protein LTR28_000126, partial [Elasticomyces elasticus]